jgi:hypothetical protein
MPGYKMSEKVAEIVELTEEQKVTSCLKLIDESMSFRNTIEDRERILRKVCHYVEVLGEDIARLKEEKLLAEQEPVQYLKSVGLSGRSFRRVPRVITPPNTPGIDYSCSGMMKVEVEP